MKSLCLYASYINEIGLPYYSSVYLKELKKQFTEVVFLHSNKLDIEAISFCETNFIKTKLLSNDGFDFGQWQKVLKEKDLNDFDQLCLVNDSCVLFKSLDNVLSWFNNSTFDFGGLTESLVPKKHLQSYFLLFNKTTFQDLVHFFNSNQASNNIHQVIADFEIGLSQYLISKNYTSGSFLINDGYVGEFSPYYQCVNSHIKQGSPMIKKKILFSSYRKEELFTLSRMNFNIDINYYINLINEQNHSLIITFDKLLSLESNKMNAFQKIKFRMTRLAIQLYRKIKK
jgi:hypothetical protein